MKTLPLLLLPLALAACGGASADLAATSIQTGAGTLAMDHALPKLPAYAPAYPGAAVVDSIVATPTGGRKGGGLLSMTTGDAPPKVLAFYEHAAAAAGLRENHRDAQDGDLLAAFDRAETKQSFSVDAEPGEGGRGTKITLTY